MAAPRTRLTELAADPYTSLSVHFGMLLGVSDIELLAANPRGKLRLHNAWLHGPGVVWGYRVTFDAASREVAVDRGLALDAVGRELFLNTRLCLDLDKWFEANHEKLGAGDDGDLVVDVVVRHRACLDRAVPAVAGECDDTPESAYSRVIETVQIDLEAPADGPPSTFRHLRRALGQRPGSTEPDTLAALVARDSLELEPPEDDAGVILARITIKIAGGRPDVAAGGIDHSVRRVHVPTMVVTELLGLVAPAGPHLDPSSVAWPDDSHVTVLAGAPVHEATLAGNVVANRWDGGAGAWAALSVTPTFDAALGRLVLDLGEAIPAGTTVRIVVTGSGPTPVTADVDGRPVPLAGDAVLTIERS